MKYNNKKLHKLKQSLEKYKSGDGDEQEIYNPLKKHIGSLLSHGKSKDIKSINISHKQNVGKIVNRNNDKRYNKVFDKIKNRMKDRMKNS